MHDQRRALFYYKFGWLLVFIAFVVALLIFGPVLVQEVRYVLRGDTSDAQVTINPRAEAVDSPDTIIPVDTSFGIVVPKIGANAPVIAHVDPLDPTIYRSALKEGVAHAKGTQLPGDGGYSFLFAHSSDVAIGGGRYNTIFYLLDKLSPDDEIIIVRDQKKYTYKVTQKENVDAEATSYLEQESNEEKLVLMTCWPPGTTLRRLVVHAELVE